MRGSIRQLGILVFASAGSLACGASSPPEDDANSAAAGTTSGGAVGSGGSVSSGGASTGSGGSAGTAGNGGATSGGGNGGSLSAGGSSNGGTGGTLPHVVGACDDLGAPGAFEDITPAGVDADALAVGVDLHTQVSGTVYASVGSLGGSRGFYRSTDCGSTWTKLDSGQNSAAINSGFQWSLAVDPRNGEVVYAVNGYGGPPELFKSTNGGVDWTSLFPPGSNVANVVGFTQAVAMDPTNPDHLAVTFHDNCTGDYAPACMAQSTDAGATWTLFKAPASGWEEGSAPMIVDDDTILYASGAGNGLFYTTDLGANWEKVANSSGGQQLYKSPGSGKYYLGSFGGVYTSDDAHTWTLIPNSPISSALIGTGQNLYTTAQAIKDGQPFYAASEANPSTWTKMPTSTPFAEGGSHLAYDADHQLLYSSNYQGRLSRVVVE